MGGGGCGGGNRGEGGGGGEGGGKGQGVTAVVPAGASEPSFLILSQAVQEDRHLSTGVRVSRAKFFDGRRDVVSRMADGHLDGEVAATLFEEVADEGVERAHRMAAGARARQGLELSAAAPLLHRPGGAGGQG